MPDTFSVTAAYDKLAYAKGSPMTVTISGGDVLTQTTTTQTPSGSLIVTITAADGATTTINVPSATINTSTTTATLESVKITGIVDSSGRSWAIASGGLSATSMA